MLLDIYTGQIVGSSRCINLDWKSGRVAITDFDDNAVFTGNIEVEAALLWLELEPYRLDTSSLAENVV